MNKTLFEVLLLKLLVDISESENIQASLSVSKSVYLESYADEFDLKISNSTQKHRSFAAPKINNFITQQLEQNEQGIWVGINPPYGYSIEKKEGKDLLVPNEHSKYVKAAFKLKAERLDNTKINDVLNHLGGKLGTKNHRNLFSNKIYSGFVYSKTLNKYFKGCHTPIVDNELFNKVNEILKSRKSGYSIIKENNDYPLSGWLVERESNRFFFGYQITKKSGKVYHYYVGGNNNRGGKNISAINLHSKFTDLLDNLIYKSAYSRHLEEMKESILKISQKFYEDLRVSLTSEKTLIETNYSMNNRSYLLKEMEIIMCKTEAINSFKDTDSCIHLIDLFIQRASEIWKSNGLQTRKSIQRILFPKGLWFHVSESQFYFKKTNTYSGDNSETI